MFKNIVEKIHQLQHHTAPQYNQTQNSQILVPILKTASDPIFKQLKDQLLFAHEIADLRLLLAIKKAEGFKYLKAAEIHAHPLDLIQIAYSNIIAQVQQEMQMGISEYATKRYQLHEIRFDSDYLGTLMYLDEIWQIHAMETLKMTSVVISIPRKDLMLFANIADHGAIKNLYRKTQKVYTAAQQDQEAFSKKLYMRTGKRKWIIYDAILFE